MTTTPTALRRYRPADFAQVRLTDAFWAPRLATNRTVSIPWVYGKLVETGRIEALHMRWQPGTEPVPHIFWDSDVAKWVEGASYDLALHPDPKLAALVEEVTSLFVAAQQPDGYLNTHFTQVEPERRWKRLRFDHELYCAGHLLESALAHFRTTRKRDFFDALVRYMDYIDSVFGRDPGKLRGYCGHPEIELALLKLYRETGEARYLRLGQYFLEERGQAPSYFQQEAEAEGTTMGGRYPLARFLADKPLREQTEAVGHSVCAMYLYAGATDLAAETEDASLRAVLDGLWESVTQRRMYLTGGIGSTGEWEGFTTDYDLPNKSYAETCAAIGLIFFAHRMLQFECDRKYSDVLERALYNGFLSGVALDGTHFFYDNPLESRGTHHREGWFEVSCCPTNVVRFLPTLGAYMYSTGETELAVHLYAAGEAHLTLASGLAVTVRQETRYPWEGQVRLTIEPEQAAEFALRLRLPGWCRKATLSVNGTAVTPPLERGYAVLSRSWQPGEVVELDLTMPVEKVAAHPEVAQDVGRVALQRGPLVYGLEDVDHEVSVHQLTLSPEAEFTVRFDPDLLGGVAVLEGEAAVPDRTHWEGQLYRPYERGAGRTLPVRAVPYYAWDNRAPGGLVVWVPLAQR